MARNGFLMKLPGIIAGVNSSQTKAGLDRPISLVVVGEIGAHRPGSPDRDRQPEQPRNKESGVIGRNYNGPKVLGCPMETISHK
jgi:hypothetical protein